MNPYLTTNRSNNSFPLTVPARSLQHNHARYDTLNRLQTLTPPSAFSGGASFGFGYDALSRRTQMTRPNNITTNYSYDNLSRLLSVLHQSGATTLDGASYTVDNAGNRTSKTDLLAGVTSNYTYDAIYELTKVMQGASTTEQYTYDPVGNRLTDLAGSYSNNSSNQLTASPIATFLYDSNGNTTSKTDSGGTTSYAWDYENRLASVTLPSSGGTVSFKYDPFGHRIQKSFTQNGTTTTTNYVYDSDNLIEEVDPSGNVLARYTQTQNVDEPLAMLRSGATSFYNADALGSVTSLANSAGTLAQTYTFDSFGKQTASSGSLTNPFRYTGREFDTETSLYYDRARYFDLNTGRFLSEDPIRFSGATNFYAYVGNNSTNFIDPKGLLKACCRPANLGDFVGVWAVIHLLRPPCHCFLQLEDGSTLGGYHSFSLGGTLGQLVLRRDDRSDSANGPNHNRFDCETLPGKPCENDRRARDAFNSQPKILGGYGFGTSDAGTSNDAARLLLKQAGFDYKLPLCAWGRGGIDPFMGLW